MSGEDLILPLARVAPDALALAGGKGCNLAVLSTSGFRVPETLVVTAPAYRRFVEANDLEERILLEINRKAFADMRWEEIWDAALRIRNLFVRAAWPTDLETTLRKALQPGLAEVPTVVRSSSTSEDSAGASFAGLHESYVNVRGLAAILAHVRKVWASLWSDAALLYRQELGLTPARSDMAVLIQELVTGACSGVAFSVNPLDSNQSVIEAVPGLNQGLVDGIIAPARWILDRGSGALVDFSAGDGREGVFPTAQGTAVKSVAAHAPGEACLSVRNVERLAAKVREIEACFGVPQDVEWTLAGDDFTFLQSRPVTATADGGRDQRGWYLSLRRSYENLGRLRTKIEDELIPEMIRTAQALAEVNLDAMDDQTLAEEIGRRGEINQYWSNVYYADFIPFAHGVRLFGQVYNDALKPDDPYAFVALLTATPMESLARNQKLEALAALVRGDADLAAILRGGRRPPEAHPFRSAFDEFLSIYGDLSAGVTGDRDAQTEDGTVVRLVLELAAGRPAADQRVSDPTAQLENRYLDCFHGPERAWAADLLDLARTSYRLRDDDNIHLARIEAQLRRALRAGRARLENQDAADGALAEMVARYPAAPAAEESAPKLPEHGTFVKARQLVGQPAGPGLARGRARVVRTPRDLGHFRSGEILVCDAVDPNMTFVVPLAAGIVERRGGMLIHGAIIAREYGLPCVTGVPEIMRFAATGDEMTVDGYLGIVIIGSETEARERKSRGALPGGAALSGIQGAKG
jgi:pyruvate,water dikinase